MLFSLVITFLPRDKHILISWLHSPSAVILEPPKIKSATVSTVSPSICHEVMGLDAMILVYWMLSFKPTFSLSSFTFINRLLSSSSLSAIRVVSSAYLRLLIFLVTLPAIIFLFLLSYRRKRTCSWLHHLPDITSKFNTTWEISHTEQKYITSCITSMYEELNHNSEQDKIMVQGVCQFEKK